MLKPPDVSEPTDRWVVTRIEMRLADFAVLFSLFLLSQSNQPGFGGSARDIAELPVGEAMLIVGLALSIVGWVWIRRIARGDPEPEANDQFWWSRA